MSERRWTRCGVFVTALSLLSAASVPARGADAREQARQLFTTGKAHYAAGRYAQAVQAFERAGKLRPSPILDFNIGRCHERLGRAEAALAAYQRYLRARPKAANRTQVEASIARLRQLRGRSGAADPYEDLERRPGGDGDHGSATVIPPVAMAPAAPNSAPASAPASSPASRPSGHARLRLAPTLPSVTGAPGPAIGTPWAADIHGQAGAGAKQAGAKALPGPHLAPQGRRGPHLASQGQRGPRPSADPRYASFGPRRGPAEPRRLPPPRPPAPRDEGPVYRQWWFWTAIGVGVLIGGFIIGMAASGSSTNAKSGGLRTPAGLGLSF